MPSKLYYYYHIHLLFLYDLLHTLSWNNIILVREKGGYNNKAKDVFILRRLSTVCFVCMHYYFIYNFLSNDVRHEGANIFLYIMDN